MDKSVESGMGIYDWLQCIVYPIVVGILVFIFIGRISGIDGESMMQTLQNGDIVIISNLFYTPENGDIVFVKTDSYGDKPLVKRVIAHAGQTVDIDFVAGVVSVDGVKLDEKYTNTPTNLQEDFNGPVTVPAGCIFVMGDNRNNSADSRSSRVGFVDTRDVLGKVLFVLIPGLGYGTARDFSRLGFVH